MIQLLASHWLTLASIVATGIGVVASALSDLPYTWSLAIPIALFAVNLFAATISHPRFRRNTALLVFHLALFALLALTVSSRLTYLQGWAEVATDHPFDGKLVRVEKGPLHPDRIGEVQFVNEGFSIDYAAGLRRRDTVNTVSWLDPAGRVRRDIIGDDSPLVILGYRFYTSANKGYTSQFEWLPNGAPMPYLVVVNFPSYPLQSLNQAWEIQLPAIASTVWAQLQLPDGLIRKDAPTQFRVPSRHSMVIRVDNSRWHVMQGEWADLPGGRLRYVELNSWMGYRVFYDWTRPWLFAALLTACLSLGWYTWSRFHCRTWQIEKNESMADNATQDKK